jgi:predicted alpha-1,6-mannanase (GH76 family)
MLCRPYSLLFPLLFELAIGNDVSLSARQPSNSSSVYDWGTGESQTAAAIDAMMTGFYNQTAGRWQPEIAWWTSGNALQALLDYIYATGNTTYLPQVLHTIDIQSEPLEWWPEGGGSFRADSTDDTGWWALAMVRMYDLTGNQTYLNYAILDEEYMHDYWNDTCGGGIIWDIPDLRYKNAISNELYFTLAASLHNRIAGDAMYLNRSLEAWEWFSSSGMINAQDLINDGLSDDCANNNDTVWSYNQGVILAGLVELYVASSNASYIATAVTIADAALKSSLVVDGILTEPCETAPEGCDYNQQAFKGIFARYLGLLDRVLDGHPYTEFLLTNAQSAWDRDRNVMNFFGVGWDGPFNVSAATVATQASAASLLLAAMDRGQ